MPTLTRICLLCLSLLLTGAAAADDWEIKTSARVVAFGDVHGAYQDWTAMLRELGVVGAVLGR